MSGCACGHHHHHHDDHDHDHQEGRPIQLAKPLVALSGRLICHDMPQMLLALDLLPEHVALSRAEPGNLRFDLAQTDDPMIWRLNELFADDTAFAAHQARTKASRWGVESTAIQRDFQRREALPHLRPEKTRDAQAISNLLELAFDGRAEAALVNDLRRDGDLALSMVAEVSGIIVAHLALSPLRADGPALALAPVAVHPALQGRGIGSAMIHAVLAELADHTVVVLGDPGFYTGLGFAPVELASPYAGPHLMGFGPTLPKGSAIHHAKAFAAL
ncbi:GNAT family N-acetyltransferase [Paracoccus laeviglucosivorans]|uniref:Putative acetyltransferase n=1 Tax=Paracoccus laeviglucosivorans TaxID=1197861 RepID=A0A521C9H7_9RHOB|nr:GNAT family N-acetyltransferase [Paracoccus laeviglucosivorans]SMO55360.1 putative acetyltransferase [Paracoccus laeviglucosivorans]